MKPWLGSAFAGTCCAALAFACGSSSPRSTSPARVSVSTEAAPAAEVAAQPLEPAVQPTSAELPIDDDDVVHGAADALLTIVEFSDLECPFCARVQPTLAELATRYGGAKLRRVFKHNPLAFHRNAEPAARYAQAVKLLGGDGVAQRFILRAFQHQKELGQEASLASWVSELGLDPARVAALAESEDVKARVRRDMELAREVGATGTPAFFINGVKVSGAQPLERFVEVAEAELAKAEELVRKGTAARSVYAAMVAKNFEAPPPKSEPAEAPADLTVWNVPIAGAPARGPADALVTIVAFYDYQCPFCKRVQATVDELLKRYPQDVRLVVRHNPLPFHPRAAPAANLAMEVRAQRGDQAFFEISRRLYESAPELGDDALLGLAAEVGLDRGRAKRALAKSPHQKAIEADSDIASDFQARGVPHFFINGVRLSGAQALEKFVEAVEREKARALALVDQGVPRAGVYAALMKTAKAPPPPETKLVPLPRQPIARGPAGAPIVIQVFGDFECPFCKRALATARELDARHPGQIRWVFRHLPLAFHKNARPAARAAMEAHRQRGNKGFWAMHDALFEAQGQPDGLSEDGLVAIAEKLKLDVARFRDALTSNVHDAAIEADERAAKAAGINGTPAFTINGYFLSGAQPVNAFEKVVRHSRRHPAKAAPPTPP